MWEYALLFAAGNRSIYRRVPRPRHPAGDPRKNHADSGGPRWADTDGVVVVEVSFVVVGKNGCEQVPNLRGELVLEPGRSRG